ncbi:MAG: DUF4160 domain-containing protein [Phycisphaerales bacterium]|nr:DUF4160 domain-containing protein [Phycisphaerales bacterium]
MPKVCEFYGVRIYFYFDDHAPPHFHAFYGDHEAQVAIESLEIMAGSLPNRAHALVAEWALPRRAELRRAWRQASKPESVDPIAPLP